MDDPAVDPADLDRALRFIRTVNRRLGGAAVVIRQLEQWSRQWPSGAEIRLLDVGTGSADIPVAVTRWARRRGLRVHVTGVDLHPTTLEAARRHVGDDPDVTIEQGDALRLGDRYETGSFDYAHAGMFLHHLDDIEVLTMLCIMERLSRRGLIWNDLVRGWVGRLGVRVLTARAPEMVRHDARVSVDAGFTRAEAMDLAERAGLAEAGEVRYRAHLGYRFTLTCEKR